MLYMVMKVVPLICLILFLITTAAGLIIAAPAIALYFIIKNRIMRMASLVEVKVEEVITKLYLDNKEEKNETEL